MDTEPFFTLSEIALLSTFIKFKETSSPTFKLISEYNGYPHNLFHIDCYRIKDIDDFFNIGGERYLAPENAVTLIEWADIIIDLLNDNVIDVHFSRLKNNPDARQIKISGIKFDV